ncbi:MAG: hypothetical protein HY303_19350, partial [Candidatus Wallbacteria bacterium]|nr:hypothetical protein [Candidatus Wallbacteria bacterium]
MAYDSSRKRSVLFGGGLVSGGFFNDTWEWSGAAWSQPRPSSSPPARGDHTFTYDSMRQRMVLFGGTTNGNANGALNDTWELPSNRPPALSATFSPSTVYTGQTATLAAAFSDPDGDTPSFRWQQTFGPRVSLNNPASALSTFSTTLATSYGFEAVAADGHDGFAYSHGTVNVLP